MFRSAALCCGARTIGVVLTGALRDGASGLWALKESGAITVVQDPSDADVPDMPRAALSQLKPDHVAPLTQLPALLMGLVAKPVGKRAALPDGIDFEVQVARGSGAGNNPMENIRDLDRLGRRSVLACPVR
jgi:two-component system, chemotaxis family, protein-glutamate methylesterase/glutaminase